MELRRGEEVLIGRAVRLSPHAGYFRRFEDVSRRQLTLRMDADGRAFARDEYSTNGTTHGGVRLAPGAECRLRGGDVLGLGARVWGTVEIIADGRVRGAVAGDGRDR